MREVNEALVKNLLSSGKFFITLGRLEKRNLKPLARNLGLNFLSFPLDGLNGMVALNKPIEPSEKSCMPKKTSSLKALGNLEPLSEKRFINTTTIGLTKH
jgi:hypothetical protein